MKFKDIPIILSIESPRFGDLERMMHHSVNICGINSQDYNMPALLYHLNKYEKFAGHYLVNFDVNVTSEIPTLRRVPQSRFDFREVNYMLKGRLQYPRNLSQLWDLNKMSEALLKITSFNPKEIHLEGQEGENPICALIQDSLQIIFPRFYLKGVDLRKGSRYDLGIFQKGNSFISFFPNPEAEPAALKTSFSS